MSDRDIGRLESDVSNLKSDMIEMKADVKLVLAKLNEDKGVFKALGWGGAGVAAAAGTFGGYLSKKLGLQ